MKIDSLSFMFLNNIKCAELIDVDYKGLLTEIPKVCEREVKSMSYQNNSNEAQEFKIETSKTITEKSS